ncbi:MULTISPECIES: aminomethyl-transferring glycine dehydrogenase [Glutamicibacter]|uniref:Glycine dehydrogenase (decarboxylating) n=1 Tax=Glutamicibacter halophytocola TaxID=1933880 RepID=A0AA95BSA3_9MICC|nr:MULTISPECIES: aminomethyl-transferring glycine dehydrogenase [Glutamicibacter]MBF6672900.1 aminomethyl-transferring glycine dehydrogenase [Glutamicibacter sp. FBE19]UUX58258.1 aminomethyl-transferring glycine dehydrogenase [Glutamicibacter halophytocola]
MTITQISASTNSEFVARHIGPRPSDVDTMLQTLGYNSLEDLIDTAVPADIRQDAMLDIPAALSETQALAHLRDLASKNVMKTQMIGQGFYDTITPAVIRRNIVENPAWYTAYTPYQPEISQGRLEALLNFQTMVMDLTGLPIANASLLDESSAAAEAVLMMRRANKKKAKGKTVLDSNIFPQTIKVVQGRADALGFEVEVADLSAGLPEGDISGIVLQQPGSNGSISEHAGIIAAAKEAGAMVTVIADLLALTMITPPGEQGADIAVGNTQRFGVPLFFGGPHAAYMAVADGLTRSMPGRLVGVSVDDAGVPAYRLALQTREQHIRREKATSNICTAQALLAICASMYAVYHGPAGLKQIASRANNHARVIASSLVAGGFTLASQTFFDTVVVNVENAGETIAKAIEAGINLRKVSDTQVGISTDETTTSGIVKSLLEVFGVQLSAPEGFEIPAGQVRTSDFMTHPIFNTISSETQMMRYLRRLSDRDLALDRTMIPLGSCTMKLNSAAEMESITWPEFASIHPYAPAEQTEGWRELITDLEGRLTAITGYAGVSIQPNAGSQGEYAGLLAISDYHASRGEGQRNVCLIPASAHGTNAASAVLAGMKVVVVKTAADGTIDANDLDAKIEANKDVLSAIMITYPSTHGVYDADVREVCDKIHAAGGQVYIDGANMNAMVGLAQPGKFGGDVSHLNLHKTFCIPHGGGGPGVGPIGVGEHLLPFLPGDASGTYTERDGVPVVATAFGSAGVLPISWAYIAMMGGEGLTEATKHAILNANYIAKRLNEHFPVLFTGNKGLVAHECILDLRELTAKTGVTAEDVAKRLIDFGFHAPTLSFPVAGTLMVEPTESEDLGEIERFIEAMITIRQEMEEVLSGVYTIEQSPLRNAPHTVSAVVNSGWDRKYSVEQAAFPVASLKSDKYFPAVGRIDGAGGDRNLICSCPAPEAFED